MRGHRFHRITNDVKIKKENFRRLAEILLYFSLRENYHSAKQIITRAPSDYHFAEGELIYAFSTSQTYTVW